MAGDDQADLSGVWDRLESGDVAGGVRQLRFLAERVPLGDLARVVGRAAAMMEFTELVAAASAVAAAPADPRALYDFGYACIDRGVSFLAIPALSAALREAPAAPGILTELVTAYEDESRHAEAVRVLEERDALLRAWPDRYLLVHNSVMSGDLDRAERHLAHLIPPLDQTWAWAYHRLQLIFERIAVARRITPLDRQDLRGWHFVLNGGLLATVSPYGYHAGMTGRYAYLQDSPGLCRRGLLRLGLMLRAADERPQSVSLLPDRSSRVLGLAASEVLGLPARPYEPGQAETVVIAYQLDELDESVLGRLRERVPGQILVEHATCWTEPPPITPDVSVVLHQVVIPPWGERLAGGPGGASYRVPPDERPVEAIATDILVADASPDTEEGAPADPDERLVEFVTAVRAEWPQGTPERDPMKSAGPVASSRFL